MTQPNVTKLYEFVKGDEIAIGEGRTLKRIRALIDVTELHVAAAIRARDKAMKGEPT